MSFRTDPICKILFTLCNELYTVGQGGWSGFPPHKHDSDRLPNETKHDETYMPSEVVDALKAAGQWQGN